MAIIEVPDISIVKTVNGSKQLLSLRDQKIKKDGVLHSFGVGSGVKYNGDLYVLGSGEIVIPEDVDLLMEITTSSLYISFKVIKYEDIFVDWGDGVISKNNFSHTYTDDALFHNIRYYGTINSLGSIADTSPASNYRIASVSVKENVRLFQVALYYKEIENVTIENCSDLWNFQFPFNNLSSIDIINCNKIQNFIIAGNPIIENKQSIIEIANLLPDRTGLSRGLFSIRNSTSAAWIQDICTAKNWEIS